MAGGQWMRTRTGVKVPWIIYGTAWKKERTADLVVTAVKAGFRGIDTAGQPKHYDEPRVGEALCRLKGQGIEREALFVQTKFTPLAGQDPSQVPYDGNAPIASQVAQSFEASQRNLRTPYVDALLLHSPIAPHDELMKVWGAMERIHAAGGTRLLGISNCYDLKVLRQLYTDAGVKPAIVQNRFYQATAYDTDLRQWCSAQGVIYQGFWTLTANRHLLSSSPIKTIARKCNKTEVQIFFRYLHQSGIVPLNGTCSQQHMNEDLNSFDVELSSEDVFHLDQLLGI
jgi:diketogulonate reductase-like aldo/keto reductase